MTLYIVATPIGNLGDISLRALEILKSVDTIVAEDTRHTQKLLTHFDIHKPLLSYFEHNELIRIPQIIAQLNEGRSMALVSDAGTPGISDPGFKLIREAIAQGVSVVPVPGASALTAVISAAGLPTNMFTFVGFLPDTSGKRKNKLAKLKELEHTLIFYVSKWKAPGVVADMLEIMGDRNAVLAREVTKIHETFYRGRLSELLLTVEKTELKGELVLVLEGAEEK